MLFNGNEMATNIYDCVDTFPTFEGHVGPSFISFTVMSQLALHFLLDAKQMLFLYKLILLWVGFINCPVGNQT